MKTNFNFSNLYSSYLNCRKHKRKTYHSQKFEIHLESEILKLEKELKKRTYCPKKSICFIATELTLREIFAATFRDRVIHHLLYNFLEPIFESKFISQSTFDPKSIFLFLEIYLLLDIFLRLIYRPLEKLEDDYNDSQFFYIFFPRLRSGNYQIT